MSDDATQVNAPSAPASGRDLLRLAVRAGVLTEAAVRAFLHDFPLAGIAENPTETAELLVHTAAATHLEVELLLLGCPNGPTLGRYQLLDVIGKGGMATVFLAEDASLRRPVAVKVMKSWGDQGDLRERFRRETLAAATLAHPNVVRTYDVGEQDGVPYLVMERLTGRTLHAVRQRGPLAVAEIIDYVRQTALGLHAIHEAGLVHRDVKPGNVMLCRDGAVKLLDLGLVRFTKPAGTAGTDRHRPLTRTLPKMSFVGTPQYLAPEQILNSAGADHRADLFGLGATLYYLVTARPPRVELPPHLTPAPAPPDLAAVFCDLPPALARLAARLLATDPDKRPRSALEVADELDVMLAALETRPNIAKRTGVIPRQSRAIPMPPRGVEAPPVRTPRRRPVPLLIGSAAVVLVAGLVAPALWAKARRAAPPVSEIEPAASHIHSVGVLVPAGTPVRGLALSPDKKLAAVTRSDGVTQLWDLAARRSVVTLPGGGARCSTVAFSADGRRLVFGASRNAVGVWDVAARAVAFTFEAGDWVLSAAISADGTRVAAGDKSGTTWVWNTATNESRAFAHGAKPRVDVVAFAPGRLTPVSGFGSLGEARAWGDDDTHFRRPGGWVHNGMCVLADGRVVTATATEVAVFDGATGGFVRGIRATPADSQFGCVAGGPGGTWLATGGSDGAIRVWDTRTGGQRASLGIRPQPLVALAVSSDGTDALIATPDGCVRHVRLSGLE